MLRKYLGLVVIGCLVLHFLVILITPLIPVLIVLLIVVALLARMLGGPRRLS